MGYSHLLSSRVATQITYIKKGPCMLNWPGRRRMLTCMKSHAGGCVILSVEHGGGKEEYFSVCDFVSTRTSKVSTDEALTISSDHTL